MTNINKFLYFCCVVIALAEKACVGFVRSFVKSARRVAQRFHRSTNTDCAVFLIYIFQFRPEFRRCTMCLVLAFSEAATGSTRCFPQTQGYHGNSKELDISNCVTEEINKNVK
ncbi:uncharacterized protein [Montipora capricornis]|uniref:uncharacterized protein n=1 Tax=Montipora capricornis TaxID=246305 RepID=UPI0035F19D24